MIRLKNKNKIKWRGKKILNFESDIVDKIPSYFKTDEKGNLVNCNDDIKDKIINDYKDDLEMIGDNEEIYRDDKEV